MTSLTKSFSIDKIYADLQKYQANLAGFKDSRLRRQSNPISSYQRPNSTHHKNHESRQSLSYANLSKFQKPRAQLPTKSKQQRQTLKRIPSTQKKTYLHKQSTNQPYNYIKNNLIIKQPSPQIPPQKQNQSHLNHLFTKNDQIYFFNQCNKLYQLNKNIYNNNLGQQNQQDFVKILLNQINKRDKIYQIIINKFGQNNIEQKLQQFFINYQKMKQIIIQFKKLSKLNLYNDQQLYHFLINQQNQNNNEQIQFNSNQEHL